MSVLLGDLAKVLLHQLFLSLYLGSPLLKRHNTREQNMLAKIPNNYKSVRFTEDTFKDLCFHFVFCF